MPNKLRELCAQAIERNGGYSRFHQGDFPLSWNVGLYYADLDRDHIYEVMTKEHGKEPMHPKLDWNEQQQWDWGVECLSNNLNDDDAQRTYSPETAKRYGLPMERFPRRYKRRGGECAFYPAAKPGWVLDDPYECTYFDVEFGLYGRGGKHLCVEEFDGKKLSGISARRLAEDIRNDECGNYSNAWCRNLLAMIGEWDQIFTSKNASAELEYQAAFRMHCELCDLNKESEEVAYWAARDIITTDERHAHA